jgi:F-type H+-transporting ATPase subunit delta
MNTGLISIRYAKAFLQLGIEKKDLLDILYDNSLNFYQLMNELTDFNDFIKNPIIHNTQKKDVIYKTFSNFHDMMFNFINVIIDNKREKLMKDIFRNFLDLYRREAGIKNVTVITAIPVADNYKTDILKVLGERLKSKVELECKVDAEIIGGLVIIADDKQADGSIAGELRILKKKMMN